jgi:hypothetical protein
MAEEGHCPTDVVSKGAGLCATKDVEQRERGMR